MKVLKFYTPLEIFFSSFLVLKFSHFKFEWPNMNKIYKKEVIMNINFNFKKLILPSIIVIVCMGSVTYSLSSACKPICWREPGAD